jgi:membrane associated rhomboid family serine protease
MPPVTRALLIACIAGYGVQVMGGDPILIRFALWPLEGDLYTPPFVPWQLVTYAFLHGGFAHLFFNGFALYMFGPDIERLLGTRRYLVYFFTAVVGAALTQLLVLRLMDGPDAPTIGASGGVFGLLLAYGLAFPKRRLMLLFPPIPMPAWLFVTLYGVMELVLGVTGTAQGVAHFAHLGGMAAGLLLVLYWRGGARGRY